MQKVSKQLGNKEIDAARKIADDLLTPGNFQEVLERELKHA